MAGAYCKFCGQRCFVYRVIPDGPSKGWSGHMATCARGMAKDREITGHTHETAVNPITDPEAAEAIGPGWDAWPPPAVAAASIPKRKG